MRDPEQTQALVDFCVEKFGTERISDLSSKEVFERLQMFKNLTQFDIELTVACPPPERGRACISQKFLLVLRATARKILPSCILLLVRQVDGTQQSNASPYCLPSG